jgi:hypothetical protein
MTLNMSTAMTRVAPERADFSPALSLPSFVGRFLRGINMKRSLHHLNLHACVNHLGLSKAQVFLLDEILRDVNINTTSLVVHLSKNDRAIDDWTPVDGRLEFNGKKSLCVSVRYSGFWFDGGPSDCLVLSAPWSAVRKGAPDKGHCVYQVNTSSFSNLSAFFNKNPDASLIEYGRPLDLDKNTQLVYIGKTSVGVANRFKQHLNCIIKGSNTKFYKICRGLNNYQPQLPVSVGMISQHSVEDDAYDAEEHLIAAVAQNPTLGLLNSVGSRQAFADLIAQFPAERSVSPEEAEARLMELKSRM